MNETALRMPRQVYRLRTLGLALGCLCIGSVWDLLAVHGLVWPHVAWLLARSSADPHGAERRNLIVDSAMGGIFVAALREQLAHIARVGTLGEMAAGLAHELNQPLTAIHPEANALASELVGDAEEVRRCLARISEQSLRAGEIVRRMRTFARRGNARREAIDLGQLVREVLALLDHDLRLNAVETSLALHDDLPPVVVDRIEIQQVLVNLIRNAMEAMAARSAPIRCLTISTESMRGNVRVSVSDTGGGVDPALSGRLFHPFQTTKPAGLGQGLSICQTLIEAHGGRIGAGPHPTGGAMFFFDVPTASVEQAS